MMQMVVVVVVMHILISLVMLIAMTYLDPQPTYNCNVKNFDCNIITFIVYCTYVIF
jgi:hypothetical protein